MNAAQNPAVAAEPARRGARPARDAAAQDASTAFKVLGAISVAHLMNDMIQSILLAIYPMLRKDSACRSRRSA